MPRLAARRDQRQGMFRGDYHDPPLTYGWSVIIQGRAQVLSANADILDAEEAPLRP